MFVKSDRSRVMPVPNITLHSVTWQKAHRM
jgi:hypothetical protein